MFYYLLNEKELKIFKEIEEETNTSYEIENNLLPLENVMGIVEDLLSEINSLNEKLEDLENDVRENYRPIPVAEQYGISDEDFI